MKGMAWNLLGHRYFNSKKREENFGRKFSSHGFEFFRKMWFFILKVTSVIDEEFKIPFFIQYCNLFRAIVSIPYYISVDLERMLEADFTTGAVLISFGAVLGVASPVQLIFMIISEVVFYNVTTLGLSDLCHLAHIIWLMSHLQNFFAKTLPTPTIQ